VYTSIEITRSLYSKFNKLVLDVTRIWSTTSSRLQTQQMAEYYEFKR